MKSNTDALNIPKTGRIGRFAKIVESKSDVKVYLRIMDLSDEYNKYKPDKKAIWWSNAIQKLETELGLEKATEIMTTCGSKCCGKGLRKTAKRLMDESTSIKDFLERLSKYQVKDGDLEYHQIDSNTIIARHNKCFCGQVKKTKEPHKTDTYCQCSVEFNRQFFMAALEKPVKVKLNQSIISGSDFCEFEIAVGE